jgi:phospholipase C
MSRGKGLCSFLWLAIFGSVFTLVLTGCGGGSTQAPESLPVAAAPTPVSAPTPPAPANPTASVSVSATTVKQGSAVMLSWQTQNANSISLTENGQSIALSGNPLNSAGMQFILNTAGTTIFALTATGAAGTNPATASVSVAVTAAPRLDHVIVVVLQNNSFDHLFGTYPAPPGNTVEGISPTGLGYQQVDQNGNTVTPFALGNTLPPDLPEGYAAYTSVWDSGKMDKFAYYNGDVAMGHYDSTTAGISTLWDYANQFALADHYFQSSWGEAPTNQLYMVAAADNDRNFSVNPFYPPCQVPDSSVMAYTFPNLADQFASKQISWGMYQQGYGDCASDQPLHNAFQYFTSTNASPNMQDYSQFSVALQNGTLPALSFVIPNATNDMHPGYFNPISVGTQFLDTLIKQVQSSAIWSSSAIIITFDDGGGWYDHVAPPQIDNQGLGFRVPTLVISPFAKKGYVSHVVMDHVSILKLIQWNWNLASLNSRNAASGDMLDLFQF